MSKEHTEFTITSNGGKLKVTVEGESEMPFWNHDLKLEAILSLLNTIDYQEFRDAGKDAELYRYQKELIELIEASMGFDGLHDLIFPNEKKVLKDF